MLRRLLSLLAGVDLDLGFGGERSRLRQRAVLPRDVPIIGDAESTFSVLMWRVALQAAAHATGTIGPPGSTPAEAMRDALPRLRTWLGEEWPAAVALEDEACRHAVALGQPDEPDWLATIGVLPEPPVVHGSDTVPLVVPREALPQGTERRQQGKRTAEVVELPRRDDGGNPLAHVFEKVKTAEEHTGGHRAVDGEDELDAQLEALEELDLRRVVRTHQAASSVFRADVELESRVVEIAGDESPGGATFSYDEWDESRRRYLPGWCAVHQSDAGPPPDQVAAGAHVRLLVARHAALLRSLRLEFARLARGHTLQRRQPLGADLDLDAIVDHHGTVVAARRGRATAGEGRLYTARRPAPRDLAALVLLDRSLSSDSWVQGRRVLDVARDATLLLGEVLRDVQLPVAVATFCSHSRRDCRFEIVKGFDGDWRRDAARLFGVRPDGYTRIGPALRHATVLLARQPARRRLLLVVSDCKPVDYDHYEGRRGVGDVRQALREARRVGVRALALTIDAGAGPHLPRMFGPQGFRVVPKVADLTAALARMHERLLS